MMDVFSAICAIENSYQKYSKQTSKGYLNIFTNKLIDDLLSISYSRDILNSLVEKYKFTDEIIAEYCSSEDFEFQKKYIKGQYEILISFNYQIFCYYRKQYDEGHLDPYYNDIVSCWDSGDSDDTKLKKFKIDFIKPIVDYVLEQLDCKVSVISYVKRFKQKIERFGIVENGPKNEKFFQKMLCCYLFDQGLEVYSEVNNGNGRTDLQGSIPISMGNMVTFTYRTHNFIIETKYAKNGKINIEHSLRQLGIYKEQNGIDDTCLVVFTDDDSEHVSTDNIIWIYVGNSTPRKRSESK